MKNRASEFIGDTIIALAQILALCAFVAGLAAVIAVRTVRPIARVVIYLSTSVIFYSLWVWMLLVTAALAGT